VSFTHDVISDKPDYEGKSAIRTIRKIEGGYDRRRGATKGRRTGGGIFMFTKVDVVEKWWKWDVRKSLGRSQVPSSVKETNADHLLSNFVHLQGM
jgi:hypothetical protein